ncbi:MAG TPA: YdcF family protein [Candidatus Sulfotelmatobacter sp.]
MSLRARPFLRVLLWLAAAAVGVVLCLLHWGADLLIASAPAPGRVDAAIVLQGSVTAEKVRIAGAIDLLQRGIAGRALLSVPRESYWGQSIPPVARAFLERNYGSDLASRVDFCETSDEVDSTAQEAEVLGSCIRERGWHSVMIVTSDYHTRRAGMLWRKASRHEPNVRVWIEGVKDPDFQQPWWRHRRSAKVWIMESAKLVWATFGGQ